MAYAKRTIELRDGDRETLDQWVRSRTAPQRQVERARIILGTADGLSGHALSAQLRIARPTIQRWLDRYETDGIAGLDDQPRPGRPRKITTSVEEEVVRMTLEEKVPMGTHWSTRLMAKETGLHFTQISQIWRTHGLKPHRTDTFKLSTDPRFVENLRDVVGLYVAPPERAIVFSFDEKSQIQALDRTQPGLPLKKSRAGTMTHDYKRHGTTTLFAALDVASGAVIHECMPRHRHQEFLRFLKKVEKTTDRKLELRIILDNYATHKHPKVKAWLEKHAWVQFHFVPTSSSWLNLVERLFSELTERQIRRLAVNSVAELEAAIRNYLDQRNREPKPYVWTASVESIIEKVARGNKTLSTPYQEAAGE